MNSQDFLLILVSLIVLVLVSTWVGRKPKRPTQLDLKAPDSQPVILPAEMPIRQGTTSAGKLASKYSRYSQTDLLKELPSAATTAREAKNLNILFNYNGHTWDAYEVLGVPAGATLSEVTQAYQRELVRSEAVSHEFLETAYKAILDRRTL